MEDNRLEDTYESENILTKIYFRAKVWLAIKLAKLKKEDIVLDFGCGGGWLEKKLKGYRIYGYDSNPKKTFIKNYKKIKPDKIFVLDVFEHIHIKEIQKILEDFKEMSDKFDIIVSVPTENWISKKIRKFVGKSEIPKEHITQYKEITTILKQNFELKKKINFFTVAHLFLFEYD